MQLGDIKIFLSVVELRHFRRAAERLGINQSQVSRAVARLEQDLGVRLLHRNARLVSLTPAATAILPELADTLSASANVQSRAKQMERAARDSISIAAISSLPFVPFLANIIRSFRVANPDCHLTVNELGIAQQVVGLIDGTIDAGFARLPIRGDFPTELRASKLYTEPVLLALPKGHRFLAEDVIDVARLRDLPLIAYTPEIGGGLHDLTNQICARAGFTPSSAQVVFRVPMALSLVAAGLGLAFVPAGVASMSIRGVAFRPLSDRQALAEIALLRRARERAPIARRFIAMAMSWMSPQAGPVRQQPRP